MLLSTHLTPSLADISRIGPVVSLEDALQAVSRQSPLDSHGNQEVHRIVETSPTRVADNLAGGATATDSPDFSRFPSGYRMEAEHLRLLGQLVRIWKPEVVVETGVADGASSRAILSALEANRSGRLTSLDIRPGVGSLVPVSLRHRWRFEQLPVHGKKRAFLIVLKSSGTLDMFVHDSNHSYSWQLFEYESAYNALRPGGLLLSDDVDYSYAMTDFAIKHNVECVTVTGGRKMFGIVIKPSSSLVSDRFHPGRAKDD